MLKVPLPVEPRKRFVYNVHCPSGPGTNFQPQSTIDIKDLCECAYFEVAFTHSFEIIQSRGLTQIRLCDLVAYNEKNVKNHCSNGD